MRGTAVLSFASLDRMSDTEEIKRHFNVVAESLRSEIRTLGEGIASTNLRLDRFESRMAEELGEIKAMIRLSFGQLD